MLCCCASNTLARLSVDVCWNRSSTQCRPNSPKLSLCDQSSCLIRSPSLLEQISALSSRSPLLRRYPHRHSLSGPYLKRFKMLYCITAPSRMGSRSIVPPRQRRRLTRIRPRPLTARRSPQVAIHLRHEQRAAAIGRLNFKLAGHDKIVDKAKRQESSRDDDQGLVDVL